ncbi:hypothetical protein B5V02_09200 [Mesorhizobium kowhaii]|uniref:Uncharacterized protein n=1 Tax=Mesorhizobium kowhaii TaxID=1300272 RepID=A0A2W7C6K9_9HYPH|nr:hypothetical protein B5V02_09200 [Mesorhizobium kowhaii]
MPIQSQFAITAAAPWFQWFECREMLESLTLATLEKSVLWTRKRVSPRSAPMGLGRLILVEHVTEERLLSIACHLCANGLRFTSKKDRTVRNI